jgi:predicted HAD superfamily Cof-like phosphohydrolase
MESAFEDVIDFHTKFFPHTIAEKPGVPNDKMMDFRIDLLKEEFNELVDAMRAGDLVGVADACADLKYVILGTEVVYGIPSGEVWDEVHASNMSKDINREGYYTTGKAIKGANYFKPQIKEILEKCATF